MVVVLDIELASKLGAVVDSELGFGLETAVLDRKFCTVVLNIKLGSKL
jgi:hypothetical protein